MAANTGYWQVRYEDSPGGLAGPVVVGYKEAATVTGAGESCAGIITPSNLSSCADPLFTDGDQGNDSLVTTKFRDYPVIRPEQLLFGSQYQIGIQGKEPAANTFELPVTLLMDTVTSMRSVGRGFENAGDLDFGVLWTSPDNPADSEWLGNLGWEGDAIHPHVQLQMSPAACRKVLGVSHWPWESEILPNNQLHLQLYRPSLSSGYVFSGLTMLWSWGLDDWSALNGLGGGRVSRTNPDLQKLTRNILDAAESGDFGEDCSEPISMSYFFVKVGRDRKISRCF